MSKRIFNQDQIMVLSSNPNVKKCSPKSITYAQEFKLLAINKYYQEDYGPKMIFEEAGFDLDVIGRDIPEKCMNRWRKIYNDRGVDCLGGENRGLSHHGGRPRIKGLTEKERIKRMEIEIAYLKAENDFLAKLRAAKKR